MEIGFDWQSSPSYTQKDIRSPIAYKQGWTKENTLEIWLISN